MKKKILFTRNDGINVSYICWLKDINNTDEQFDISNAIGCDSYLENTLFYHFDNKKWTLNEMIFFARNNSMNLEIYSETGSLLKTVV